MPLRYTGYLVGVHTTCHRECVGVAREIARELGDVANVAPIPRTGHAAARQNEWAGEGHAQQLLARSQQVRRIDNAVVGDISALADIAGGLQKERDVVERYKQLKFV